MAPQGGFGLKIKIEIAAVLTVIVNVKEGEFPELEKVLTESTGHNATGGYATYIATGKFKANSFKLKIGWDRAQATHDAVSATFDSLSAVNMSVEDPGATEVIAFSAHIFKMGRVSVQEGQYECNVEIQPTGQVTITAP